MPNTFTVTYQIRISTSNKDHTKGETVNAFIKRTSPETLNTVGVSVASAKINMTGTTFWSGSGNNPYLNIGKYGRVYVSTDVGNKGSITVNEPAGFSLDNLLNVGTTEVSVNIYGYKSSSGNVVTYSSTSATFVLTATCVQNYTRSSVTLTSSVEAGGVSTVTFTNSNLESVYHSVTWQFGSSSHTATSTVGENSLAYTIPLSWATNIPNATSGPANVTVSTYASDGTDLGSNSYLFTISVPASVIPAVSLSATRIDNAVPSSWGIYVSGKSGVRLTASASGTQGSTITSYSLSGGASITQALGTFVISKIHASGLVTYSVKVTDSRGRTASDSVTLYVTSYSPPSFSETVAFRCNASGEAAETGAYISARANGRYDSLDSHNTIQLSVRYGLSSSEAYSARQSVPFATAVILGNGLIDTQASYKVLFELTDAFGTVQKAVNVGTAAYTVFFRQGGGGVAFGKVSERNNAVEINEDWGLYHGSTNLAGTVPVSRGGTGATTVAAARNALGLGNTSGAVPVENGGTGATTAEGARNALGLGNTSGALPVANGGTGAADAATARSNLGITLSGLGAAASTHEHNAQEIASGTLAAERLPFRVQYGMATVTGVSWTSVSLSGFTEKPIIVVSFAGNASSSGINVLKTQSESKTGFQVCMAGSSGSGTRSVNWIAIGT